MEMAQVQMAECNTIFIGWFPRFSQFGRLFIPWHFGLQKDCLLFLLACDSIFYKYCRRAISSELFFGDMGWLHSFHPVRFSMRETSSFQQLWYSVILGYTEAAFPICLIWRSPSCRREGKTLKYFKNGNLSYEKPARSRKRGNQLINNGIAFSHLHLGHFHFKKRQNLEE
jgi:hypothetical protein